MSAEVLSNPVEGPILGFVYFIFILSEIIGASVIPRIRQRGVAAKKSDRGSKALIFAGTFVAIAASYAFAINGVALLPASFFWIGVTVTLMGIIVRQWAIAVLGRFFSTSVRTTADQVVVSRGPYRLVRHPSYTGALLGFVGFGLALESWGAVLVILLLFGIVYGYRISVEEKALKEHLGDAYLTYMKRTKRLIPYLL